MKTALPSEAQEAAALVASGCAVTAEELDAMPVENVERLVDLREVLKAIEYGLEMNP